MRVLSAVLTDGLEPVEAAVREALANGTASDELILNILSRHREPATPHSIVTSNQHHIIRKGGPSSTPIGGPF